MQFAHPQHRRLRSVNMIRMTMVLMMLLLLDTTNVLALSPLRKPFMGKSAAMTQFASSSSKSAFPHSPATTTTTTDIPAWSNLPFKRNTNMETNIMSNPLLEQQPWIQTIELVVGRIAVLSAIALISQEIATGQSFAEQIHDVFQTLVVASSL
jgi:hypothetical protein